MKKLKQHLEKFDNPKILDAATGQGTFMSIIAAVYDGFSEIIGIDTSDRAIEAVSKNFEDNRISAIKMDISEMTFKDCLFDIVCLSNSMHHVDDINKTISLLAKATKDNGILIFNEMRSDNISEKQHTHTMLHHFWAKIDSMNNIVHKETMTLAEMSKVFSEHPDIKVLDTWELNFGEKQEVTKEAYDWLKNTIDSSLKRVEGRVEYDDLLKRGNMLKMRLDDVGFESASQVITILKKNKS